MRRSRRRRGFRSRLTLGRALLIVMIAFAAGVAYLISTNLSDRNVAGFPFPCSRMERTALHVHPHLEIMINGENVTVPANIGIIDSGARMEPLHTHDASGTIHVESPDTTTQYTLGQFFQIWDTTYHTVTVDGTAHPITFSSTEILGYKADGTHRIVLLVAGRLVSDYNSLVLNALDKQTILIQYEESR